MNIPRNSFPTSEEGFLEALRKGVYVMPVVSKSTPFLTFWIFLLAFCLFSG